MSHLERPEIKKFIEYKCDEKLKNKSKIRTDVYDNIEHKWQCIQESIIEIAEEMIIRENRLQNVGR